jgi:hypothetical protein
MLFSYTYVPHKMEKMQELIDFIFFKVWCEAPIGLAFNSDLFSDNSDLKLLMSEFGFSAKAAERGRLFYKEVKEIYELFAPLTAQQVDQFRQWYRANNEIEKICLNSSSYPIVRYKDVISAYPVLGKRLACFFRGLYDHSLLGLAAVKAIVGDLKDHNNEFFLKNTAGKCPFCGVSDLKGIHHTRREAYDHYLPKYRYPFNSINFKNLAPACHECNSAYKLSKDPAHNLGGRRKAFYPYSIMKYTIRLDMVLRHPDVDNLTPTDITLTFGPAALSEEIDTWKSVYGIEERYKAKICGENDGKFWLAQVLDEWREDGRDPEDFLKAQARHTRSRPYAECNFIKKPFLEACKKAGII